MPSLSAYRQLVLVDADDGRLSLFKDHQQYLSHMAPNCEWCLFWNDLRLPVYKKLTSALRGYFHIRFCPSYHQRSTNSLNPDLLDFLETLLPKFSFVLLVHGDKQPYSESVQRLQRHYGKEKLEVQTINERFSQHLPSILTLLTDRNATSSIRQSVTNVSSKDHLKFKEKPRVFRCEWPDNLAAIPYGLVELIYFNQLIKRKQKRLNIYYYNGYPSKNTLLLSHLTGDDEFEEDDSDHLTTVFARKSVMKLRLISYKTFTTLTQERSQTSYSIKQYSLAAEQTEAMFHSTPVPKLQKYRKSPKQKLAQPVKKKTPESDSKEVSCSKCTKKFKDQVAQQSHFWAKHSKPSSHQAPSQQQASLQYDRAWVNYYDNYINYLFNYPSLLDYYGSSPLDNASAISSYINPLHNTYRQAILQCRASALMIHGQTPTTHQAYSIPPIKNKAQPCLQHTKKTQKYTISSSTSTSKKTDHQSNLVEERTKWNHTEQVTKDQPNNISHHSSLPQPRLDRCENAAGNNFHSMTTHPDRISHFTASSEAVVNTATIVTKSYVRTFPCSKCTTKFKCQADLQRHVIAKHLNSSAQQFSSQAQPAVLDIIVIGTDGGNPVNKPPSCSQLVNSCVSFATDDAQTTAIHSETDYQTASAAPRLSESQLTHGPRLAIDLEPAVTANLTRPIPSIARISTPLCHYQMEIAQEQTQMTETRNTSAVRLLSCSQCTKKFQSIADIKQHFDTEHTASPTNDAPTITTDSADVVIDQATLIRVWEADKDPTDNLTQRSSLPQPHSDKDRTSHRTASSEAAVKPATMVTKRHVRIYPCSKCSKGYNSSRDRLQHFIKTHSESFLPTTRPPHGSLNESRTCWICSKEFKSSDGQITHFIDKHAQVILRIDGDPSSLLQTHIRIAQEKMESAKSKDSLAGKLLSCSKCTTKFKCQADLQSHIATKHSSASAQQFSSQKQTAAQEKTATVPNQSNSVNKLPYSSKIIESSRSFTISNDKPPLTRLKTEHKPSQEFGSATDSDMDIIAKSTQSILSASTLSSSPHTLPADMGQEQMKIGETRDNFTDALLSRSQCTEKFQSVSDIEQHDDTEDVKRITCDTPTIIASNADLILDQGQITHNEMADGNSSHHSSLLQPHSEKSRSAYSVDSNSREKHSYTPPCIVAFPESAVNEPTIVVTDQIKTFPCSRCSKKYKSARDRLDHFIKTHSESFRPMPRSTERAFIDSRTCWECKKVFKSSDSQISHFIDKHAQAILLTQGDPSSLLQTKISMAQEKLIYGKRLAQTTNLAASKLPNPKGRKLDKKYFYYAHDKTSKSTSTKTLKVLNHGEHKTATKEDAAPIHYPSDIVSHSSKRSEERMSDDIDKTCSKMKNGEQIASATSKPLVDTVGRTMPKPTVAQILDESERFQKEAFRNNDAPKNHIEDNTATASANRPSRNFLSGQDIFICPRARSSSIVYIQLKTIREQLIVTPGRRNRCPFEGCDSATVEYEFEELCLHALMEHKDVSLKLECCDPTRTYTLEEYKIHLESTGWKNIG